MNKKILLTIGLLFVIGFLTLIHQKTNINDEQEAKTAFKNNNKATASKMMNY